MANFVLNSDDLRRPPFGVIQNDEEDEDESSSRSFEVEEISMEEDDVIPTSAVNSSGSGGKAKVQRANTLYYKSLAPAISR